jgi:hypothetical protein
MRKIALGLAAMLLSTTAYAQSTKMNAASEKPTADSELMLRQRTGGQNQVESTGSEQSRQRIGTRNSDTSVRTRVDGGSRLGVETRERNGVAVHSRTVREVSEPSVEVRRRRTVTTIRDDGPEVHRTVIKRVKLAKKVVVRKMRPNSRYVVRTHSRQYVEEPSVAVRRRSVHRFEVDEPRVSVSRRTTIRQSQSAGVRTGASVEQRRSRVDQSSDVNVSTSAHRRSGSGVEATGTVSGSSKLDMSGRSGSPKLPPRRGGNSEGAVRNGT